MSDFNLPVLSIKPILRISPSSYHSFQSCRLKEILSANGYQPLLPAMPAARIGSVVHTIIEAANAGKVKSETQFNDLWKKEIKNCEEKMLSNLLERHLIPLEETASDYDVKKIMTFKMISSFFSSNQKQFSAGGRIRQNEWLKTKDDKISGKIDLITTTASGVVISDYKTGKIVDENNGNPKEKYQLQLKLYAALYFENYNSWPDKLLLVGIDRTSLEVKFSEDECIKLLEQAKNLLNDTNECIESNSVPSNFANPSPEACKYCLFRPGCQKYWQKRTEAEEWPIDVIGSVRERGFSGNKLGWLVIEQEKAEYFVRALSDRHAFLFSPNKNVLICNLSNDTSSNHYIERIMTTGYGF